jgi:antitoxin MazE
MLTTIQRWGNSLAVRIPKAFAVQIQLAENSEVDITLDGSRIVIHPVAKQWKLDDLLARVTKRNTHEELNWGGKKGREVW